MSEEAAHITQNKKQGFIPLFRSVADNPLWTAERFSKGQAWVDLLLLANHKPGHYFKRGIKVELDRGQLGRSKIELMDRWKWSEDRLNKFLNDLETEEQITVQSKGRVTTVITVIRYDEYNFVREQTTEQTTEQVGEQVGDIQQVNKEKNRDTSFERPTLEQVKEFVSASNLKMDPEAFFYHYTANGWMQGKGKPVKVWKAAVRNWARREEQFNKNQVTKPSYDV
jgi:hypothetical protein